MSDARRWTWVRRSVRRFLRFETAIPFLIFLQIFHLHRITTYDDSGGGKGGLRPGSFDAGRAGTIDGTQNGTAHSASARRGKRKNAYAYLLVGYDPAAPGATMGYILNVLVSNEVLKSSGSEADVVLLVRMAVGTDAERLPPTQADWFEKAGVVVEYLPKQIVDNFYTAMMDKFRILSMVQYDRVLFLDSDVLPLCNLDYFFEASYPTVEGGTGLIRPNTVLSYNNEPAQGGFFLIEPSVGSYEELIEIVARREEASEKFNVTEGWGHTIRPPDYWQSFYAQKTEWDFHGAFADQGLLYHWVKYVRYDHAQIRRDKIITWRECEVDCADRYERQQKRQAGSMTSKEDLEGGILVRVGETHIYAADRTTGLLKGCKHPPIRRSKKLPRYAPYLDFVHFTGASKPWLKKNQITEIIDTAAQATDETTYWYYIFGKVTKRYNITYEFLGNIGRPPLGLYPTHKQVAELRKAKEALADEAKMKSNETKTAPMGYGVANKSNVIRTR